MIKLRSEQLDHMQQQDPERFVAQIAEHLRELHETTFPDSTLQRMVKLGLARARSHGLHSDAQLLAFVSLMYEIAPNFDQQPLIRRILEDTSQPIDVRWELLFDDSAELLAAWDQADTGDFYDGTVWFPEANEPDPDADLDAAGDA